MYVGIYAIGIVPRDGGLDVAILPPKFFIRFILKHAYTIAAMSNKLKNNLLHTILSWFFNYMSKNEKKNNH